MSYLTRLYNHRNAQSSEGKEKPFFSKKQEGTEKQGKGNFFQPKLSVNEPGDKYEHEADNVAKAVVDNKTAKPVVQQKEISSVQRLATSLEDEKLGTNDRRMERDKEDKVKAVQRAAAPEKEKDKVIQRMDAPKKEEEKPKVQKMELPEKKKEEGIPPVQKMGANPEKDKLQKKDGHQKEEEKHGATVQTKPDASSNTTSPQVAANIKNTAGKGDALPAKIMKEMSTSFGADFSNVRIHNDSEAANMNQELNAQAFTHGNDVFFNTGKYNPENTSGKFLLAHELTHVVQQNNSVNKTTIQKDDDNSRDPSARDPLAVQPGGPLDMNDQMFTLKRNGDGTFEGCGPLPGGAAGSDNTCVSADSIDKIKSYFKSKPSTSFVDRPAKCPTERWNTVYNFCCPPDKHIDPQNKFNCIGTKENPPLPIPDAEPQPKGDYELPATDNQYA